MRNIEFAEDEYYHIFGHAIEGQNLTRHPFDSSRFLISLREFNTVKPIGSIFENQFVEKRKEDEKLVDVVCYCLNPNHYHLILKQRIEGGISKIMHRVGTGYTMHYNEKYNRRGPIFRGRYKVVQIKSDEQLLYASAYVNLNDRVHRLGGSTSKLIRSSWNSYINGETSNILSGQDIVLDQFKNRKAYRDYAEGCLELMLKAKDDLAWYKEIDID